MAGKLEPWSFDAGSINYSLNIYDSLYINETINNYLSVGDHDHHFFLVGSKGTGKTLFLQFKSYLYSYSINSMGFKKYPSSQLCENLILGHSTFSKEDLIKFNNPEQWDKIWKFVFIVIACKTAKINLNEEIESLIKDNNSISSLLSSILSNRKKFNEYAKHLTSLISSLSEIQSGICIFLDNVEQSLIEFLENYKYLSTTGDKYIATNVWINAQYGLLSSIYSINRFNSHVKIYTTVRKEVFFCYNRKLLINYKGYATFLEYSEAEIKEIFYKNIALMEEYMCTVPGAYDPIEKFLGFVEMPHIIASDRKGKRRVENAFSFFYRHTFGRPREMVYLGNKLFNQLINNSEYKRSDTNKKVDLVRWRVNDISYELLQLFLSEIVPSFDNEELINFLQIIQCNVVPRDFINKSLSESINKYFSYGLIGHIIEEKGRRKNKYRQIFYPTSEYSFEEFSILPHSKYFVTHPTIDSMFTKFFSKVTFYNRYNIIGNNYPFLDVEYMSHLFDVALSFSGEDRQYVDEFVKELEKLKIRIFYDHYVQSDFWGEDLYKHLDSIYRYYAKFCVVFISSSYIKRIFPMKELEVIMKKIIATNENFLLPVKIDDTELPGLSPNIWYMDSRNIKPADLAKAIKLKIVGNRYLH